MKLILLIMLIALPLSAKVKKNSMAQACDNFEQIADIMTPYLQTSWTGFTVLPSGPTPTTANFVLQGRQPISDFCRFAKSIENLDTIGVISATANMANKISDNQFVERINYIKDTIETGAAVHRATNGSSRQNAESIGFHRRLNRFAKRSANFYEHETGEEVDAFDSRSETESKMRRMLSISNNAINLRDIGKCSSKSPSMTEEQLQEYNNDIQPLERLLEEYLDEKNFHLLTLQEMGKKMFGQYTDFKAYIREVINIHSGYVKISRSKPKYVKNEIFKNGEKVTANRVYYDYTTMISKTNPGEFLEKHNEKWQAYINSIRVSSIRNLLKTDEEINRELASYSYECRRSKVFWNLRKSNPRFRGLSANDPVIYNRLNEERERCLSGKKLKFKTAQNIFVYYYNNLLRYIAAYNRTKARIYTWESKELGVNRQIINNATDTPVGEVDTKTEKCQDAINISDSKLLKIKQQSISLEMRQMLAEEQFKKTRLIEERHNRKKAGESKRKRDLEFKKELRRRKDIDYDQEIDLNKILER